MQLNQSTNSRLISDEERDDWKANGNKLLCPECDVNLMQALQPAQQPEKAELYCTACHYSLTFYEV
jgi:hypothetical protein